MKTILIDEYAEMVDKYIIASSTDLTGHIVSVSQAFCDISGYTKEELVGKPHSVIRHPDSQPSLFRDLWTTIRADKTWRGEIKNLRKDGGHYWVDTRISPCFKDGKKIGYLSLRIDITDKKRVEELSVTDPMTGLYNRRQFSELETEILNRSRRDAKQLSLAMLDVDYFKDYNDNYGHQMGDSALIAVSDKIKETFHRADDYAFRLGGKEFGIIFECKDTKESEILCEHLRERIEALKILHIKSNASKFLTVSIGVVVVGTKKQFTMEKLYKLADKELYKAKKNGRNKVEIYEV
mgnify:FL=1